MRKPDASLRVHRSSRGLQQSLVRRFAIETAIQTSSSGCSAILNNLKRHAAFSLSLLPGGKRASKRGNASTGRESGVTVRPSFIGRIGTIIRCRLHFRSVCDTRHLIVATTTCRALDAAAPRGDCACPEEPTAQTPSLPVGGVIICAVLTSLAAYRPFSPMRKPAAPLRVRRSSRDRS